MNIMIIMNIMIKKFIMIINAVQQAWFDQYTDTDLMSVTTDDVPSLYSMTPTPSMTHRSRFSFHCKDLR